MSTTHIKNVEPLAPTARQVPPLENGDRLSRAEFERRYDAMPSLKKAELIEGIVHMPSPVRFGHHGGPNSDVIIWMGAYRAATPGVDIGDNTSIRLDLKNMPQPDAFMFILPSHGGQARISDDDYIEGAPELVAEVSSSSVSFDLHGKLPVYRRNGVREYIVWRVDDGAIDWFVLRGGEYDRLSLDAEGLYRSEVLPGLRLDPTAMAKRDHSAVLERAGLGLGSREHAAFVARLAAAGARPAP